MFLKEIDTKWVTCKNLSISCSTITLEQWLTEPVMFHSYHVIEHVITYRFIISGLVLRWNIKTVILWWQSASQGATFWTHISYFAEAGHFQRSYCQGFPFKSRMKTLKGEVEIIPHFSLHSQELVTQIQIQIQIQNTLFIPEGNCFVTVVPCKHRSKNKWSGCFWHSGLIQK